MKANFAVQGEIDGNPLWRLVWERTRLARMIQKFVGLISIRDEVTERLATLYVPEGHLSAGSSA